MTSEEYGQILDDFELDKKIGLIPEDFDLTKYIEQRRREFESKADGGMIGIEVLFGPKRDDFRVGGAAGREYGADTSASRGVRTSPSRGPSRDDRGPMLVAELTPKQKKFIDKQKFGLQENLVPARDIFNKITNPKLGIFDTGTFGFGAQEPTTEEEFNEYLKSIGVVQQVKDGGRVGFFMGGPALEGQALQIYNSMNAYGFTDQEIADALSARGLYTPAGSGTGTETTQSNIIGSQLDQGDGGGGITELQETFTKDLSGDPRFSYLTPQQQANKYRFDRSVEPRDGLMGLFDKTKNFFAESRFFQPKIRGTLGTRLQNQFKLGQKLPSPIAQIAGAQSPFNPDSKNYNPDFVDQLNFLELGDDMIGMSGTGLKYGSGSVLRGQNVISGFGSNNYLKQLNKYINRKNITDKARQRGINERRAFLEAQERKRDAAFQAQLNKQQQQQRQADLDRISRAYQEETGGQGGSYSTGQSGVQADGSYNDPFDPGGGEKDGGLIGYNKGGLATMFTRRR